MSYPHAIKTILTGLLTLCLLAASGTRARAADDDKKIRVTIYPILVKAPIYGATVELPSLPSAPGGGERGEVSGSTDVSLNAAYMGAVLVEANRWFVEGAGTWAALSADRSAPRINIKTETLFYSGRGG